MENWLNWILYLGFAVILIASIAVALRSKNSSSPSLAGANEEMLNAQISQIETNFSAGKITQVEANALISDVKNAARRNNRAETDTPSQGPVWAIWTLIAFSLIGGAALYWRIGSPHFVDVPYALQAEMRRPSQERAYEILSNEGQILPANELDKETADLIAQLEEALKNNPEEVKGWEYLTRASYSNNNFKRASEAQAQVIRLKGQEADANDYALLAESLILSVNDYISPEAENALRQALKIDPKNRVARYYAGLTMIQEGDVSDGRSILMNLLQENQNDPNWKNILETRLQETQPAAGPSEEDMANAANMSEEDRQNMIGGMVDGLKARLAEQGGQPEEWARLINALRVLGRDDEASAILGEAQQKFPNDPNIQALQ